MRTEAQAMSKLNVEVFQFDRNIQPSDWKRVFGSQHVGKYPIMSNYLTWIVTSINVFDSMEDLWSKISNNMKRYLNHSAFYPDSDKQGFRYTAVRERMQKYHIPYLFKCSKSASVLSQNLALLVWNNLTRYGLPAYLGKDIMMQGYSGYQFSRLVPLAAYWRAQGLSQSGIVLSWRRYVEYLITLAGQAVQKGEGILGKDKKSKRQSLVMFLIPIFGYSVALIVFIIFEKVFYSLWGKKRRVFPFPK